ncbi:MAG: DASH family cryptochrome [Haliscomenobacteraceae bacterium CHB4]|nr:Cryptochrome DASH [Saprospiraceae bacterium]MCE7921797.1 DASH family cryptochrome [Haliscomenobacteraceae bacterium CHB4]
MKRRAIVWFRQDLRLHDNEAITTALRMADEVIPVYVFDERVFTGNTRFGFPKTGKFRAQFVLECIADLRQNLRHLGSDLLVRTGKPECIVADLARDLKVSWVLCNRERTQEEVFVQDALEQKLWAAGIELLYVRGKMLYHTQDLPVPVHHTPDIFTQFRKDNEHITPVRAPLPTPTALPPLPAGLETADIPTLRDFGHEPFEADPRAVLPFKGGETEGLKRLRYYFWEKDLVSNYKETRNGLVGSDYSSKFSPWLAQGCLSPKMVYHELKRYERERVGNESTYWLFFELLWRDFFRLMGKKHGNRIFLKGGVQNKVQKCWKNNREVFQLWADGNTGVPFIDANMRELNATGWMSNRGRQNVASFLVKDLKVNWQMGAEYFESLLLDYDPCSNWGNWNYVAGVGSDPREDRYFNILTQAKNYDPKGEFVRLWCPELSGVPLEKVHRPDLLTASERDEFNVNGYPKALVRIEKWVS